jgi:hypothetical protein
VLVIGLFCFVFFLLSTEAGRFDPSARQRGKKWKEMFFSDVFIYSIVPEQNWTAFKSSVSGLFPPFLVVASHIG